MSTDETYNGWTNYETWLVALWLDNEPATYQDMTELAATMKTETEFRHADAIKAYVDELRPDGGSGMLEDLVTAALARVDWTAIAEHYRSE